MKLKYALKPLAVAMLTAGLAISMTSYAEVTEPNAKRVKENYPLGTMTQWLQTEATTYALNPVNLRAGKHPDREDPQGGPYDVVYIFPDAATANAWWDPIAAPDGMPTDIPADAVAFVHWELDNGSGTFPGIMSKADVDGFKSRNCIMASGAEIPVAGPENPSIEKTCSNDQGTSKRFKMNVLKADAPIDLVYNVEPAPLTYLNYDELPSVDITADGIDNPVEESGRIYRILQKFHNATGMASSSQLDGDRIIGFSLELGTGVGGGFTPISGAANDGLAPDKALGFELRPCMSDHFFDVSRDRPGTGTNPCSTIADGDGVLPADGGDDQPLPQEIWLEEEYSTFSPKMYSFDGDKRAPDGGWWDKRPAGIYPPATQTMGLIDSGTSMSDSTDYFDADRVDGATALSGYYGATTPNYFDIVSTQATGVSGIDTPNPFGYLMYHGVISEGDVGILSSGVYIDEDGDPATEGDLYAWWDGDEFRWGGDPDVNGVIDPTDTPAPWSVVPVETLAEWALSPLSEEEVLPPPRYEVGVMDDLAGLNVDSFVYLGRNFTGDQFTVRLTAQSVTDAGHSGTTGDLVPAWVTGTPAPDLDSFISGDGVIVIKATGYAGDPLEIYLGDTNVSGSSPTATVEVIRDGSAVGEVETITLNQDPTDLWKFSKSLNTVASSATSTDGDNVLNVQALDIVRVTYIDADDGAGNTDVTKTDEVEIPLEAITPPDDTDDDNGGGGGGCTIGTGSAWNITMPALLAALLGFGWMRRRNKEQQ